MIGAGAEGTHRSLVEVPMDAKARGLALVAYLQTTMHGSGLDGDWRLESSGRYVTVCMAYHCMNDLGYYDGWVSFTVRARWDSLAAGVFTPRRGDGAKARVYDLEDLILEEWAYAVENFVAEDNVSAQ